MKKKAQDAVLSSLLSHIVELKPPPPPKHPCIDCTDSDLCQLPEDALTEASGRFIGEIPLDIHTQTHQPTKESNSEDSEDASEKETVEASDFVDPETINFETGEDIDMGGDLGLHGSAISDWDILA
jgi:hypothetical protein